MTSWIEPSELLAMVVSVPIRGVEPIEEVVARTGTELIPVTEASLPPLDIATYEVRLERWREGEGPRLTGIEEFVSALHSLEEPARTVTLSGAVTTYVYLLDSDMTGVISAVAIDPPTIGPARPGR